MQESEMLDQLDDLICDRRTFITDDDELNSIFLDDIKALEQIIHDYQIMKNGINKSIRNNGENLNIWINENVKSRNVEILNTWITDIGDLSCNAILYNGKNAVANIVATYDETTIRYTLGDQNSTMDEKFIKNSLKSLIYDEFDIFLELPKISKTSKLLQEVYDCVCESDASMCHITDDDWKNFYSTKYSQQDFEHLKEEVKRYGLENVISICEGEYKIVGFSDLESCFNDDRKFQKHRKYER